jgi:hypothetical protein
MKTLPCLLALLAVASLALLAVAAALGVTLPYCSVALRLVALAWVAGVLAIFVADYAPRRPLGVGPVLPSVEAQPAFVRSPSIATGQRRSMPVLARTFDDTIVTADIATLGLSYNPATLSMS